MARYSRHTLVTSPQPEEEHQRTLELMQIEALNPLRIEGLKTSEFSEKRRDYVPSAYIQRRMDEDGTEENRAAQGEGRPRLAAWNTAWTSLQGDGTATEDLTDVNEGLGQTHRGKLQADDSVRDYTGEGHMFRGGYRGGRGIHHGGRGLVGRGGGFAGRSQHDGRHVTKESSVPVKRNRVAKGNGPNHVPSATSASPRRPKSTLKQVSGEDQQALSRSNNVSDARQSKKALRFEGALATPDDFMASILQKRGPADTPPNSNEPQVANSAASDEAATSSLSDIFKPRVGVPGRESMAIASGLNVNRPRDKDVHPSMVPVAKISQTPKPQPGNATTKAIVSDLGNTAPSVLPPTQPDILDADIGGGGSSQSVVNFTHSATSKTRIGTASPKASASSTSLAQPLPTLAKSLLEDFEALQRLAGISTEKYEILQNLKLLVQSEASEQAPEASTSSEDGTMNIDDLEFQSIKADTAVPLPRAVARPPVQADARESIAKKLIVQRNTIIGTHVHRTRFQHSALLESFQKLQTSEKTSKATEPTADSLSASNPLGPAKLAASQQSAAGPSPRYHLAHPSPVADHGAAVRSQYRPSNPFSNDRGTTNTRDGRLTPAHVAPATDTRAATRGLRNATGTTSPNRGILKTVLNDQPRSFTLPDPPASGHSSAPFPRKSMLNRTGFIGLAENRANSKRSDHAS